MSSKDRSADAAVLSLFQGVQNYTSDILAQECVCGFFSRVCVCMRGREPLERSREAEAFMKCVTSLLLEALKKWHDNMYSMFVIVIYYIPLQSKPWNIEYIRNIGHPYVCLPVQMVARYYMLAIQICYNSNLATPAAVFYWFLLRNMFSGLSGLFYLTMLMWS